MNDITVDKAELLAKVESNRDAHKAEYDVALVEYKKALISAVEDILTELSDPDVDVLKVKKGVTLPVPEEHTDDFDTVIDMLKWAQGDTLEIAQHEFDQYVRNKWAWARTFAANTSSYSAGASR